MEENSASRVKDHKYDLGGAKENSPRSRKIEIRFQGPLFRRERRGISQVRMASSVVKIEKKKEKKLYISLLFELADPPLPLLLFDQSLK